VPFTKPARGAIIAACVVVGAILIYQLWKWEIERVEVPPGEFLVRVSRWGKNLPENEIIAPDTTYKGVMLGVLSEGRHFINPIFWSYQRHKMIHVPAGKCLVLTRQFGKQIPDERIRQGDILARENIEKPHAGERGIIARVLLPGSYRINPYAYKYEEVDAIEIQVQEVGVRTLKVGKDPAALAKEDRQGQYVVPDGYRGIQKTIVPPGTYYLNPYIEQITPVEVRSHRVALGDIEFPSRDGFIIRPQMVVEYAVRPEMASELLVRITDGGVIHQADETPEQQATNEILQKVILPHIRGYARIEGSNFDARDFILFGTEQPLAAGAVKKSNAREAMQRALLEKVKPRCDELGVEVRAVTLADMRPPEELSEQIAQRELARVELERNEVKVRQYKAEQELKAKEALKQQAKEKVEAETRLVQAKTRSDQQKEVEQSRMQQELANAQLKLDAATKQAEAIRAKGEAEAAVITVKNQAEVAGLKEAVGGFDSVEQFAQYHILARLAPSISEIFVSDDSEIARLLSSYLKPKDGAPAPATANAPADAADVR